MQDRLVDLGQSWMACDEKVDGCVLEKLGLSHQSTDRITSHQDWRNILAPEQLMTNEILVTVLNVSMYGYRKELQHQYDWPKHGFEWIVLKKWHKANTQEEALGRRWVHLEEKPVWDNEVLRQEMVAFLGEGQHGNKSLSLSLEELSLLNYNHLTSDDFICGQVGFSHHSSRTLVRTHDQKSNAHSSSPFPWSHDYTYSRR